jgi:hypothetical protein
MGTLMIDHRVAADSQKVLRTNQLNLTTMADNPAKLTKL